MKKVLAVLFLLCLAIPAAAESVDLDSLSFQELAALRDRIQLEMMQRGEWQEVTVPQGVYKIGDDIPEGTWTIKCCLDYPDNVWMRATSLEWGAELDKSGIKLSWNGRKGSILIHNPNAEKYDGGPVEYTISFEKGDFLIIDASFNKAVFTPYVGKSDLGFK